jgi:hypothetical protein
MIYGYVTPNSISPEKKKDGAEGIKKKDGAEGIKKKVRRG